MWIQSEATGPGDKKCSTSTEVQLPGIEAPADIHRDWKNRTRCFMCGFLTPGAAARTSNTPVHRNHLLTHTGQREEISLVEEVRLKSERAALGGPLWVSLWTSFCKKCSSGARRSAGDNKAHPSVKGSVCDSASAAVKLLLTTS